MSRNSYSIDLIKQMAECDANYIRLLKLVPQLAHYRDRSFDVLADLSGGATAGTMSQANSPEPEKKLEGLTREFTIADLDGADYPDERVTVEIKILEAFKYTTTLEIVQKPKFEKWMTNPTMLVRVYHDANTAEVMSYQGHRHLKSRYPQPNPKMYHSDEKMQVNRFLGEWLSHCLKVGRCSHAPELLFNS